MYRLSEQQALELTQRCNAIKDVSQPALYSQIEALVKQAVSARQLTDEELKRLYGLLACAVDRDDSEQEEDAGAAQDVWIEPPDAQMKEGNEKTILNVRRIHLLLCNRANLRTIDAMRRHIQMIAVSGKCKVQGKEIGRSLR